MAFLVLAGGCFRTADRRSEPTLDGEQSGQSMEYPASEGQMEWVNNLQWSDGFTITTTQGDVVMGRDLKFRSPTESSTIQLERLIRERWNAPYFWMDTGRACYLLQGDKLLVVAGIEYQRQSLVLAMLLDLERREIAAYFPMEDCRLMDCIQQDDRVYIQASKNNGGMLYRLHLPALALEVERAVDYSQWSFTAIPSLQISSDGQMLLRGNSTAGVVSVNAQVDPEEQYNGVWRATESEDLLFVSDRAFTYRAGNEDNEIQYISGSWKSGGEHSMKILPHFRIVLEDGAETDIMEQSQDYQILPFQVLERGDNLLPSLIEVDGEEYRYITPYNSQWEDNAQGQAILAEVHQWLGVEQLRDVSTVRMTNGSGTADPREVVQGSWFMGMHAARILVRESTYRQNWRPQRMEITMEGTLTLTGTLELWEERHGGYKACFLPDRESMERLPQAAFLVDTLPVNFFYTGHYRDDDWALEELMEEWDSGVWENTTIVVDRVELVFQSDPGVYHRLHLARISQLGEKPHKKEYRQHCRHSCCLDYVII